MSRPCRADGSLGHAGRKPLERALLLALLCTLPACSSFTSDAPPVADSTMVDVLIELHLAQARQQLHGDLAPTLRDSILAHHGLDAPRLDAAFAYYADDPEALGKIYQQALDRLSEERPPQDLDLNPFLPDSLRVER